MSPRKLKTVLRKLREERGLSQAQLAAKANVTDAYVAQLETGKKTNPSLDVLKRLARALGVPVTELLE
jgi:transcriptional regulator with XRE-family HTH domain